MNYSINYPRAIVAGLVAGLVFAIMEMALVATALGGSAWAPPRMMAAIVMGTDVLPPPASFDAVIVTIGMIVHFVLSAILGIVIALIVGRMSLGAGVAVGVLLGLVIYLVNFYGFTAAFPWFANARNWVTIVSHLVFGGVTAGYYLAAARRT